MYIAWYVYICIHKQKTEGQASLSQPINNVNVHGVRSEAMLSARQTAQSARSIFYKKYPMLTFDHYCVEDDDTIHYVSTRKIHNVMLFGIDMISKDNIFKGHWPHHFNHWHQFIQKLHKKCSEEFDEKEFDATYDVELTEEEQEQIKKSNNYVPAFEYETSTKKLIVNINIKCWLCGDGCPVTHSVHTGVTGLNLHLSDWPLGISQSEIAYWLLSLSTLKESSFELFKIIEDYDKEMKEIENTGVVIDINDKISFKYNIEFGVNGDLKFMNLLARTSGPGSNYFCYLLIVKDKTLPEDDPFDQLRFFNPANQSEYSCYDLYTKKEIAQKIINNEEPSIYLMWTIENMSNVNERLRLLQNYINELKAKSNKQLSPKHLHKKR